MPTAGHQRLPRLAAAGQAGGKERPTGQVAAAGRLKHLLAERYRHAGSSARRISGSSSIIGRSSGGIGSSSSGHRFECGGSPQVLQAVASRGGSWGRGQRRSEDEGQDLGDLSEGRPSVGVHVQAPLRQVYVVKVHGVLDGAPRADEGREGRVGRPRPGCITPQVGVLAGVEHPHEDTERKDVRPGRDLHACMYPSGGGGGM